MLIEPQSHREKNIYNPTRRKNTCRDAVKGNPEKPWAYYNFKAIIYHLLPIIFVFKKKD